jgi:hypothetical protein
MKLKHILLLGIAVMFTMHACTEEPFENPEIEISNDPPPPDTIPPDEPEFVSSVPTYPILTFHILQREYYYLEENEFTETNGYISWPDYLEMRLIQLYPENAYTGMVQEDIANYNTYKTAFDQYTLDWIDYEVAIGIPLDSISDTTENIHPFVSKEDEVAYLDMSFEEVLKWNYYDSLVLNDTITRNGLDTLNDKEVNLTYKRLSKKDLAYIALFTATPITNYMAFRILQSEKRTKKKVDEFYGQGPNGAAGQISDAFKHVYMSLLLRRNLGRSFAAIFTYGYEYIERNNDEWERQMDFHNNKIGRHTKYRDLKTSGNWEDWATSVKNWINKGSSGNRKNGVDMDWETSQPNKATCESDRDAVGYNKYIYYIN